MGPWAPLFRFSFFCPSFCFSCRAMEHRRPPPPQNLRAGELGRLRGNRHACDCHDCELFDDLSPPSPPNSANSSEMEPDEVPPSSTPMGSKATSNALVHSCQRITILVAHHENDHSNEFYILPKFNIQLMRDSHRKIRSENGGCGFIFLVGALRFLFFAFQFETAQPPASTSFAFHDA